MKKNVYLLLIYSSVYYWRGIMGNCFSDVAGGRAAVGGSAAAASAAAGNDAVDHFLKSRGLYGSQIEVSH